jgi:WD40-like Beta Propeller Repeat
VGVEETAEAAMSMWRGRQGDTPDAGSLVFTEEKLYDVKNDIVGLDSTRDGRFLFWFERSPDGRVIPVVNGTAGASFDAFWDRFERIGRRQRQWLRQLIVESDYKFSMDGCHFAYVGRRRNGCFACIDGVQSRAYEAIRGEPSFDPTGSTSVYVARVDGVNRLVLNGEVQLEYEVVPGLGPAFSPDGSHIAFVARVPGGEAVVFDGKAGPPFVRIAVDINIAPNGRVSYDAALNRKRFRRPERFAFVVDGGIVAQSRSFYARLSPDGRRIYYLDHDSNRWFVDGEPLPEGTKHAEFAPDGRLYTDLEGQAFVDGAPMGVPAWNYGPVFTPDGRHSAWSAKAGEKEVLVRDGKIASDQMDVVGNPLFSPDGTRLSFWSREGEYPEQREFVVVDGIEGPRFDSTALWHFSPDSQHLAYRAEEGGKTFLMLDQTAGPPVDALRFPAARWPFPGVFEFSPDSNHVAAVAILGAQMRPLVDGRLGPTFERLAQPVFQDGTVSFFGCREKAIFRLRAILD